MQAAEGAAPGPGTDDQGQGEGADGLHHHRLSHRFAALVRPICLLTYPSAYLPTHLLNTDLSICCIIVDNIAYEGLVCEEVTCLVRR